VTAGPSIASLLAAAFVMAAGCGSSSVSSSAPPSASSPGTSPSPRPLPPIPAGRYRRTLTAKEALAAGMLPGDIEENTGTTTLEISNGYWVATQTANHPIFNPTSSGIYYGSDHVVTFEAQQPEMLTDTLRWTFDGRCLHFKVIRVSPDDARHSHLRAARAGYETVPFCRTE
jgi:hypothetical protein